MEASEAAELGKHEEKKTEKDHADASACFGEAR